MDILLREAEAGIPAGVSELSITRLVSMCQTLFIEASIYSNTQSRIVLLLRGCSLFTSTIKKHVNVSSASVAPSMAKLRTQCKNAMDEVDLLFPLLQKERERIEREQNLKKQQQDELNALARAAEDRKTRLLQEKKEEDQKRESERQMQYAISTPDRVNRLELEAADAAAATAPSFDDLSFGIDDADHSPSHSCDDHASLHFDNVYEASSSSVSIPEDAPSVPEQDSDAVVFKFSGVKISAEPTLQSSSSSSCTYPRTQPSIQSAVQSSTPIVPAQQTASSSAGLRPVVQPSAASIGGLRPLIVDSRIITAFAELSFSNSKQSIECCGIICGKIVNETLVCTALIIPKQKCGKDTCVAEHEEEILEIQERHGLLTFSWIHTHPTQSVFLSSVDLHNQHSYQLCLKESVAIVYAPRVQDGKNLGVFSITDFGMSALSNCSKGSTFHTHNEKVPLYQHARHVSFEEIASQKSILVVDLR